MHTCATRLLAGDHLMQDNLFINDHSGQHWVAVIHVLEMVAKYKQFLYNFIWYSITMRPLCLGGWPTQIAVKGDSTVCMYACTNISL